MGDAQFLAWGSYDRGKPRVRMLLDALAERGRLAGQVNIDIWKGIEDKSVAGARRILFALLRLAAGYPALLLRLMRQPSNQVLLLLYPAILDVFIVWPLARLRKQKIVFDAFICFHDTIVSDRGKLDRDGMAARLLWHMELRALKLADLVLVDTDQHGDYFAAAFRLPRAKFVTVLVGAEPLFWNSRSEEAKSSLNGLPARYVLFYGQFIPLHGIETILEAVALTKDENVHWLMIGGGQQDGLARDFVVRHAPTNLTWLPWVEYERLPDIIRKAQVSLGIFGASEKAERVIPNKMFQVLAAGGTIITRDSPAVAALAARCPQGIRLVPAADPQALADAVLDVFAGLDMAPIPVGTRETLSPAVGVEMLLRALGEQERT